MNKTIPALLLILCATAAPCLARGAEPAAVHPRIISLYAAHTEVLLRLGARAHIIGVSRQETYAGPETADWDPDVFSMRDDVEKFLAARPDIVLVRPQHLGDGRMQQALEKAGIKVRALQVTHADGLYAYWRELAALVDRRDAAEAMIADFAAEVERIAAQADALPRRPGVFIESIHKDVKTFTPDSLPVWVAQTAGFKNIAADARPVSPGVIIAEYGPERLLAHAADIDVYVSQEGTMNKTDLQTILHRDIFQPLRAFQTRRVFRIPEADLSRPTPGLLRGLRALADLAREAAVTTP